LAQDYFAKALELDPKNPIYLGFLGDTYLIAGQVFKDKRKEVKGYFMLKDAIAKWPEFNYFTAGYPMSILPANSEHFKEALEWQWKTLDVCAGEKVNRQHPSFAPYISQETQTGRKQACWNTHVAPHNFEGFFMNMGDMLVKSGDWQTAIDIYNNAKLSKTYHQWPYRSMLEKRILNAKQNVRYFNEHHTQSDKTIMFNSGYGCMACHQIQ
jgi:tetratricopeptide (TPR) repeat protein